MRLPPPNPKASRGHPTVGASATLGGPVWNFEDLFGDEDRVAAIVGAAMLEDRLKRTIRSRLRPDQVAFNSLFGTAGAMGAFGAQIELGYLMDIYDADFRRDLIDISKMRNRFAHEPGRMTFRTDDKIRDRALNLRTVAARLVAGIPPVASTSSFPTRREIADNYRFGVDDVAETLSDPKRRFSASVTVLYFVLQSLEGPEIDPAFVEMALAAFRKQVGL